MMVLSKIDQIQAHAQILGLNNNFNRQEMEAQDLSLVKSSIPKLVDDYMNTLLTMLPSLDEIKYAFFSLNCDSVPGPDGFGATFF
ncbi:unnamed protein product [Vicia faba]|uniref:Uncharacterized protein n=1 Tax=Vicia faba TaxID=3906 RepID=A0AAV0YJQ3_VICFA|nr:unnamed protein product [Vicia faba]